MATDNDGVLSPIVLDPLTACPLPESVASLHRLATRVPVAIVSGRAVDFLAQRISIPAAHLVGLYGRQWSVPNGGVEAHPEAMAVLPMITAAWGDVETELNERGLLRDGIWMESKGGLTFAVHYRPLVRKISELEERLKDGTWRHSTDADRLELSGLTALRVAAERDVPLVMSATAKRFGLQAQVGKRVCEVVGAGFDKERALLELWARIGATGKELDAIIYFGDEARDLPAFRALDVLEDRGLTVVRVAVGDEEMPSELAERADLTLGRLEDVSAMLEGLAELSDRQSVSRKVARYRSSGI